MPSEPPGHLGMLGLSRHEALHRTVVLMRLLQAEVTASHYHVWRLCSAYSDQRWHAIAQATEIDPTLRGTEDTFHCSASVFFGMLIPPQTTVDGLVRHSILGPLGFSLVEGVLRRASQGHLSDDGAVMRPFTVAEHRYAPPGHDGGRTRCHLIEHASLLYAQHIASRPTVARTFDALRAEMGTLLGSGDVWREIDVWREEWFHRRRWLGNQVPILATLLAFFVVAEMTDGDYADAVALTRTQEMRVDVAASAAG